MAKFIFTGFNPYMKITQTNHNQTNFPQFSPHITVFRGAVEAFGKHIGDTFCKTNILPEEKKSLLDEFKKVVDEIMTSGRELGRGFHGIVYKIDDNFALKVRRASPKSPKDTDIIELEDQKFRNLKTYYGEPIGRIGDVKILRNLGKHIPAAVPDKVTNISEIAKYYELEYLPIFASVPQQSYDAIARDFAKINNIPPINNQYFSFDGVNPSNIVLTGKKLILTDELDKVDVPNSNTSGKLLDMLLFRTSAFGPVNSYGKNRDDAYNIFKKIIIASEKSNLPYGASPEDFKAWSGVLKNLGFNINSDNFIENLNNLRIQYPNLSQRLPKVKSYVSSFSS